MKNNLEYCCCCNQQINQGQSHHCHCADIKIKEVFPCMENKRANKLHTPESTKCNCCGKCFDDCVCLDCSNVLNPVEKEIIKIYT